MKSELRLRIEDEFKAKHKVIGMNREASFITLKPSDNSSIRTLELRTKEWLRVIQQHISCEIKYHYVIEIGNQIASTRYLSGLGGVSSMDYHVHLVVNIPPSQTQSLRRIWASLNPSEGKYNRKRLFHMIPFRDDHSGYMAKQADSFNGKLIDGSNTKRVLKPINSGYLSTLEEQLIPRGSGGVGGASSANTVSVSHKLVIKGGGLLKVKRVQKFFLKKIDSQRFKRLFIWKEYIQKCRVRLNMWMKRVMKSIGMQIRSPT